MNTEIKLAGRIAHFLLDEISTIIKDGITTKDINDVAENVIKEYYPDCSLACKNYKRFPASLCVSVNEEIIHGIPSLRKIRNDDLVKVDLVVEYKGWFADTARTFIVGKSNKLSRKLVKVCKECLYKGIKVAREGIAIGNIGFEIQQHAIANGFSVMHNFSGHGIGQVIHKEPTIPCFGKQGEGVLLKKGMLICIEPMLFTGSYEIIKCDDKWTIKAKDGLNTAHYEHTIEIQKKNKPIIIT